MPRRQLLNKEEVEHPSHYQAPNGALEVMDVITAWDLNYARGNIIKYILRAGRKGAGLDSEIMDIEKAITYLRFEHKGLLARKRKADKAVEED